MRHDRGASAAIAIAIAIASEHVAGAQTPSPSGKIVAETLFEEGRKLVADGNFAEACPKFADSQRLDPSPATLLNLASCYEKQGHTASAWVTYREAASAANAASRPDYMVAAQRHAEALAPHLARLTIQVTQPIEGLRIERDAAAVDSAEWGIAIPVDPGDHTVFATAVGRQPWGTTVDMSRDGTQVTVTVPELEAGPTQVAAPASPVSVSPGVVAPLVASPPAGEAPAPGSRHESALWAGGWIVGGLGVVAAGVGAGFAVAAKGKYDDSLGNCLAGAAHNSCYPQGLADRNDARTDGDIATWTIAAGAVAAAAGVVMILAAPKRGADRAKRASWTIVPGAGGLSVRGQW